jgi:hypothetical protein
MNGTPVETYLTDLARELRKRGLFEPRIVEEARGHLLDAVEEGRHRGLTVEAAEHEAFERFGAPGIVAARFDAERHRILNLALFVVAVALGIAIAYVDSRPKWDDAGITAFSMLLSAGVFGLIGPQRPWLWALGIGIWIPLHGITRAPTLGSLVGGLLILTFPMVGAYAGMALRRVVAMVWETQTL